MEAAHLIRDAIVEVERFRREAISQQSLSDAVAAVKYFQSRRFAATYQDLMSSGPYQSATKFFLSELYGDANYSTRDAQFARIAGAIQRLLPKAAIATAVSLAQLHVLTERLDLAMGHAWIQEEPLPGSTGLSARYARAWRMTSDEESRQRQLQLVLEVGRDLHALTRTPGLRLLLKMMRRPAHAAGLADLQHFLEQGFDTFAKMGQRKGATETFLQLIDKRETEVLKALFADNPRVGSDYLASLEKPDWQVDLPPLAVPTSKRKSGLQG